ncbi:methanogenesis marker 6 protein [Methanotorris formicicus]|uniref:Methanogenesis marker protein 6 n=1 Tax=Methanotorris formicicus Mc-S-70 TaxID=647171 RepID=H1KWE9_9EURY|nr:methanogenesis marker 6 protein [Methanotorris formicicus]EHP89526.1 methanogenesis marker protein 6 [Methanotorris formicicus Mc-S-70]
MKTKVIVLADNAETTPSKLFRFLNSLNYDINVKETCFGAYIEGEDDVVDEVTNIVRNLEKNKIFCKDRGFPIWDKRRCRAFRGGGPREGFHQLEAEQRVLNKIAEALDEIEKEGILPMEKVDEEKIEKHKLDIKAFIKIIDEELK